MAKKILVICAALVAFAVVPAAASATSPLLTNSKGTAIATGTAIKASGSLEFHSGGLTVKCSRNELNGTLTVNSGTTVQGETTSSVFDNGSGGACATNVFGTTIDVKLLNSTLCVHAGTSPADTLTIRGGKCGSPENIKFTMTITIFGGDVGTCEYQASEIKATYATNTSPLVGTVASDTTFNRTAADTNTAKEQCAEVGQLTGALTITAGGNAVKII